MNVVVGAPASLPDRIRCASRRHPLAVEISSSDETGSRTVARCLCGKRVEDVEPTPLYFSQRGEARFGGTLIVPADGPVRFEPPS